MHDDLRTLLVAGWSFGLRHDAAAKAYWSTAKRGEQIARASGPEPMEALARAILEVQLIEPNGRSV